MASRQMHPSQACEQEKMREFYLGNHDSSSRDRPIAANFNSLLSIQFLVVAEHTIIIERQSPLRFQIARNPRTYGNAIVQCDQ